jgi:predicted phosphodiesterase
MPKQNGQDETILAILSAIGGKSGASIPLKPEEMIQDLQAAGYRIVKHDPGSEQRHLKEIKTFSKERWEGGDIVKFGALSCTHLGSRQQQLTFLNALYDRFAAEGITTVLNCGDIAEGDGNVYRGQRYDVFLHGADVQRDYVTEKYPKRNGITTYMIAGNHDWSFWQRGGFNLLESVAERRPDIVYLGAMGAKVLVDGVHVYVSHGSGGNAYARSYKPQKRIEQFAPAEKPEVFLLGHYHSWNHLPMYRNVIGYQMGCLQSQTDYLKRVGLYPEIGGLILTIYRGTKGADRLGGFVRVVDEIIPLYKPKERDY